MQTLCVYFDVETIF